MSAKKSSSKVSTKRAISRGHNTIDINLRDDHSDISDNMHGHRTCFRRDCCVQKDKLVQKIKREKSRKASQIRESTIIGGGGGPRHDQPLPVSNQFSAYNETIS
jgi:hypothetical protein